jgi:hypothetical protein
MKKFYVLILFVVLTTITNAQETCLIFGSGGGISGISTTYKVLANGKVFKGSGRIEIKYTEVSKIKKKQAQKLFEALNTIKIEPFNHPGNMSYFIIIGEGNSGTKFLWGSNDFVVPKELEDLYRESTSKLSKLKYTPVKNQ